MALAAFVFIAGVGLSRSAYFPDAWGWCALVLGWAVGLGLLRARLEVGIASLAAVAALCAFVAWVGVSIAWSSDVPQSVFELERDLVYVLGAAAILLHVRRPDVPALLAGLLAAIVALAGFGLLTRLFPPEVLTYDEIFVNRLGRPIGYWNALGAFTAMGIVLAIGYVARGSSRAGRIAAGAALPILATTVYFTFSRGALIALGLGLLAALAVERQRLKLIATVLVVAAPAVVAVAVASRAEGLTTAAPPRALAVADGHHLSLVLLVAVAVGAALTALLTLAEPRVRLGLVWRRALGGLLAILGTLAVVGAIVHYGGPSAIVDRAYHSFLEDRPAPAKPATAPPTARRDLNDRLFTLRANGRQDYWASAWDLGRPARWRGAGAGTFEQWWLEHRPYAGQVLDAHGLYAEVIGELGWIGLALLLVTVLLPFVAVRRARATLPWASGAVGAYTIFAVHLGVDWDWELPAVTLTGLTIGLALLAASEARLVRVPAVARVAAGVLVGAVVAFSLVGAVANRAVMRAEARLEAGRPAQALREVRPAIRWAPWMGRGWMIRGEAARALGRHAAARADLRIAARKDPRDWRVWLALGNASSGEARARAYARAARLNPFQANPDALRRAGYQLPRSSRPR